MKFPFRKFSLYSFSLCGVGVIALILALCDQAAATESLIPAVTINTSSGNEVTNTEIYTGLKLAFLISSLSFIPALVMAGTCFTRIAVVLSLTRQALGIGHTPPNQILIGLAMFLTFAIMGPVFDESYREGFAPFMDDQIGHQEAFQKGFAPLKRFMLRNTREQDLELFAEISKTPIPESAEELGPIVVLPAFTISELNTAFQIAFLIYVPFLILDMIISSVLTSMSMITLPPTVISLPIKLMLFVVIDGWNLVIGNLVKSYHM